MKLYNLFLLAAMLFLFTKVDKTYDCKYTKNSNISYTVYKQQHCPPLKNYVLSGFKLSKNKNYNDF